MPSIWLSIIYFFIKNKFIKKILIKIIFILLILPSLPIVSTTLEKLFYNGLYKISIQDKKPAYILVLGAGADATGKYPTTESLKRAEHGIGLSKKYSATLIFSGGLAADILPNFFDLKDVDYIKEVKTACLWKKKSSTFEPDFCPVRLDSDPWIVQPTEHYEELSMEEIIKRNK